MGMVTYLQIHKRTTMRQKQEAGTLTASAWLSSLATDAGLTNAGLLNPHETPLNELWSKVARTCGISEDALACYVAAHLRVQVANFASVDPSTVNLIPEKIARQF